MAVVEFVSLLGIVDKSSEEASDVVESKLLAVVLAMSVMLPIPVLGCCDDLQNAGAGRDAG